MIATILTILISINYKYYVTPVVLVLLLVYQIYALIAYIDKTNRELAAFLESIRFGDFTRNFKSEHSKGSFGELYQSFNNVIQEFQNIRSEKEEHYQYLQSIVQNIDVSVIIYFRDGNVELINKAAKKLFQVSALANIRNLESVSHELVETLLNIKPGRNYLVKVQEDDDILQLAVNATELRIKDKVYVLASVTNIQNVLEEQETEAWQKLIRVLTHEIMNSITPIASLTSTLEQMLTNVDPPNKEVKSVEIEYDTIDEFKQALQTINKRSAGLLHFVNTYRNLTRIPKPNFKITPVASLLKNIKLLVEEELKQANITCKMSITPENLEIYADGQLLEQVILNMIKNSAHSLEGKEDATISLKAYLNKRGRPTIQVIDNGKGILPDVLDKIFIPFFTTKPNGSGIGLSLSRQIIRLHNGSIHAQSEPDKETVFTITL